MNTVIESAQVFESIAGWYVDYPSNQEPYDAPYTTQRFYYQSEEEAVDVLRAFYSELVPHIVDESDDLPF